MSKIKIKFTDDELALLLSCMATRGQRSHELKARLQRKAERREASRRKLLDVTTLEDCELQLLTDMVNAYYPSPSSRTYSTHLNLADRLADETRRRSSSNRVKVQS